MAGPGCGLPSGCPAVTALSIEVLRWCPAAGGRRPGGAPNHKPVIPTHLSTAGPGDPAHRRVSRRRSGLGHGRSNPDDAVSGRASCPPSGTGARRLPAGLTDGAAEDDAAVVGAAVVAAADVGATDVAAADVDAPRSARVFRCCGAVSVDIGRHGLGDGRDRGDLRGRRGNLDRGFRTGTAVAAQHGQPTGIAAGQRGSLDGFDHRHSAQRPGEDRPGRGHADQQAGAQPVAGSAVGGAVRARSGRGIGARDRCG